MSANIRLDAIVHFPPEPLPQVAAPRDSGFEARLAAARNPAQQPSPEHANASANSTHTPSSIATRETTPTTHEQPSSRPAPTGPSSEAINSSPSGKSERSQVEQDRSTPGDSKNATPARENVDEPSADSDSPDATASPDVAVTSTATPVQTLPHAAKSSSAATRRAANAREQLGVAPPEVAVAAVRTQSKLRRAAGQKSAETSASPSNPAARAKSAGAKRRSHGDAETSGGASRSPVVKKSERVQGETSVDPIASDKPNYSAGQAIVATSAESASIAQPTKIVDATASLNPVDTSLGAGASSAPTDSIQGGEPASTESSLEVLRAATAQQLAPAGTRSSAIPAQASKENTSQAQRAEAQRGAIQPDNQSPSQIVDPAGSSPTPASSRAERAGRATAKDVASAANDVDVAVTSAPSAPLDVAQPFVLPVLDRPITPSPSVPASASSEDSKPAAPLSLTAPTATPLTRSVETTQHGAAHASADTHGRSAVANLSDVERARLVQRVSKALQVAGERSGPLRLRLSPPELGSVRVEIEIHEGKVHARLATETAEARTALLENAPALREGLAEHHLQLERFDVELLDPSDHSADPQTFDQSLAQPHQGDETSQGNPRSRARRPRSNEVVTPLAPPSLKRPGELNVII